MPNEDKPSKHLVYQHVGRWEYILLVELNRTVLRAKIDSGAHSSALGVESYKLEKLGETYLVSFQIVGETETFVLPVHNFKKVKSSNGQTERRPTVLLSVMLGQNPFAVLFTLTERTNMEFPVLLGASALSGRFLIDPARSRLHRKPRKV